jgi:hypothetical protein
VHADAAGVMDGVGDTVAVGEGLADGQVAVDPLVYCSGPNCSRQPHSMLATLPSLTVSAMDSTHRPSLATPSKVDARDGSAPVCAVGGNQTEALVLTVM